jgi:hypothetical protein
MSQATVPFEEPGHSVGAKKMSQWADAWTLRMELGVVRIGGSEELRKTTWGFIH